MHEKLGKAVMVVFEGCYATDTINHAVSLSNVLQAACWQADVTVLGSLQHQFIDDGRNDGASAVVILAESHAAAHSWPRHNRLVCVVYTCGDKDPMLAVRHIASEIGARRFKVFFTDVDEMVVDPRVPWVSGDT